MTAIFRRGADDQRGQVAPLVAMMMTALMGFAALSIDVGNLYAQKRVLQLSADASSLAAVQEQNSGASGCILYAREFYQALLSINNNLPLKLTGIYLTAPSTCGSLPYGPAGSAGTLTYSTATWPQPNSYRVVLNAPPTSGAYSGNISAVEASITEVEPTVFAGVLGVQSVRVSVRSVGLADTIPLALLVLSPASNAITLAGGNDIVTAWDIGNRGGLSISGPNTTAVYFTSCGSPIHNSFFMVTGSFNNQGNGCGLPFLSDVDNGNQVGIRPSAPTPYAEPPVDSRTYVATAGCCAITSGTATWTGSGGDPVFTGPGTGTIQAGTYNSLRVTNGTVTVIADPLSTDPNPTLYFAGAGLNLSSGGVLTDTGSGSSVIVHPTVGNCSNMISVSGTGSQLSLTGPSAYNGIDVYVEGPSSIPANTLCGGVGTTSEIHFSSAALANLHGTVWAPDDNVILCGGASPASVGTAIVYTFTATTNGGSPTLNFSAPPLTFNNEHLVE